MSHTDARTCCLAEPHEGGYGRCECECHDGEAPGRDGRLDHIRSWRDQTAGIYGLPPYPSDPPMVWNNKGWWQDVNTLLTEIDRLHEVSVIGSRGGSDGK